MADEHGLSNLNSVAVVSTTVPARRNSRRTASTSTSAEAIHPSVRTAGGFAGERCANAGAQLPGAERLGDVVVGAEVEAEDLLGLLRLVRSA